MSSKRKKHAWGPGWTGRNMSASMWAAKGRRWGRTFRRYESDGELRIWYGLMNPNTGKPYGAYRIRLRGKTITIDHHAPTASGGRRRILELTLPPNSSAVFGSF